MHFSQLGGSCLCRFRKALTSEKLLNTFTVWLCITQQASSELNSIYSIIRRVYLSDYDLLVVLIAVATRNGSEYYLIERE